MISIIIPAFNEENELSQCLDSLAEQKIDTPFEVILVDNNSTDKTAMLAQSYKKKLNIKVIHETRQGRGQARYTGFRAATGNIFFSTDADAVVPPHWLSTMTKALSQNGVAAVAGPSTLKDGSCWTQKQFNFLQPLSARFYRVLFGSYWLPGFNFAISRDLYFKAGEFDFEMDALEDNDLSWRVRKLGKIIFVPQGSVAISGRRFIRGFWLGMWEYLRVFIIYFFLKNKHIHWSNIR